MNKIILFLFLCFPCLSQTVNRIEIPLTGNQNNYQAINLGEEGLILINKSTDGELDLMKYDQDLKLVWDSKSRVEPKADFIQKLVKGNQLFLLFGNDKTGTFELKIINIGIGGSTAYNFHGIPKFNVVEFDVDDGFMVLGGYTNKDPSLLFYSIENPVPKVLTASYQKNTGLQQVKIVDNHVLAIFALKSKNKSELLLRIFDKNAKMVSEVKAIPDAKYDFLNGKYFESANKSFLIGNYGFRNSNKNATSVASQGLFIFDINDGVNTQTRYYSFTQFKNFFSFLNDRQQDRVQKKIENKKKQGKDLYLDYTLKVDQIEPYGDGIILTAEVFKPEYRNNYYYGNSMYNSFGGFPMTGLYYNPYFWGSNYYFRNNWLYNPWLRGYNTNYQNGFDGFRYFQGLILAVNSEGDLLWDTSVPYKNFKRYDLVDVLNVRVKPDDEVVATYSSNGDIFLNSFKDGKKLGDEVITKSDSGDSDQRVKNTDENYAEYWFDNYFLNFGIQKIGLSKNVFFVNKVAY